MPGSVIWITGLSGAGKTTLASALTSSLRCSHQNIILLDGDELRHVFKVTDSNASNHSREARLSIAFQYSRLCKLLSDQGFIVVIATISMFNQIHNWNRENVSGYLEVFLNTPLAELRKRDPKNIYKKFFSNDLKHVAGLNFEVDEPLCPDIQIDFDETQTVSDSVHSILKLLNQTE